MWPHISYSEPNFLLVSPPDSPTPIFDHPSLPTSIHSISELLNNTL